MKIKCRLGKLSLSESMKFGKKNSMVPRKIVRIMQYLYLIMSPALDKKDASIGT